MRATAKLVLPFGVRNHQQRQPSPRIHTTDQLRQMLRGRRPRSLWSAKDAELYEQWNGPYSLPTSAAEVFPCCQCLNARSRWSSLCHAMLFPQPRPAYLYLLCPSNSNQLMRACFTASMRRCYSTRTALRAGSRGQRSLILFYLWLEELPYSSGPRASWSTGPFASRRHPGATAVLQITFVSGL